jgi:hypothetical protein
MEFLEKLRGLPETQRKLILWAVVIILGLLLFVLWVKNVREKLQSFPREEFKEQIRPPEFPRIEMPATELPSPSAEELKQLEEQLKEAENAEQ